MFCIAESLVTSSEVNKNQVYSLLQRERPQNRSILNKLLKFIMLMVLRNRYVEINRFFYRLVCLTTTITF